MPVWRKKAYVPDLRRFGALCEANYGRIRRLRLLAEGRTEVAEFELQDGEAYFGRVRIEQLQQSRFTETLLLEQVHNAGRWLNNPQLTVRVYHDAGLAEVISCYRNRRIEAINDYPNRFMHHPDEKTQVNAFLADWLSFCLRFGHVPAERIAWPVAE
ncbi:DUF1249 domain-containing protein [Marinobacter nanhaiticus D15-8W]|uniref:DUF1249 domain-containing protein n=2 Tax=Marinobacter TaxID=2742 RepID=N6VQV0_9GAMM|nr:DUF1249 domain-containing protein [Marinobacter nanhaiticus]ENO12585.2 DUF1249 domain-containing protein [Marinobacter nanhaiticus D15-8W]